MNTTDLNNDGVLRAATWKFAGIATRRVSTCFLLAVVACLACVPSVSIAQKDGALKSAKATRDGRVRVYGLISPLDQEGRNFYLLTADGQVEVRLDKDAAVGLLFRERNVKQMLAARKVELRSVGRTHALPKRLYVKVLFKDWGAAQKAIKSGSFQDGMLYAKPLPDHLPTKDEPWLSGELTALESGHITPKKIVTVSGKRFVGSTSGHNYSEQIADLFDHKAIEPFVNEASVYGQMRGDVFHASVVLLRPIPDQVAKDNPKLPRYLFIGDSISGNYGPALRKALEGKFNVHHPPTNCGPSGKGKNLMQAWLGDYKTKGRHWDVISFNFGHWDAGNTKADYQANLEKVIEQLKATGAKLIWVTTCPVPDGYDPAGALSAAGEASGRKSGVMKKYLNPWALEVVQRHPEITICNQWQYCQDHRDGVFKQWWAGKNVHFRGEPAAALGRYLAAHVRKVMRVTQ